MTIDVNRNWERAMQRALREELTVKEAAELLKVHVETVRVWLRAGRFPNARRISKRAGWRIPRHDVDQLGRE